jgi:organic radical activating enzyme
MWSMTMPRREGENYDAYKARMIDPVSETYCAAKWLNATIWLGSGMTSSCHHPQPHRIDVDLIKSQPSSIHNTAHKKQMRALMLAGIRPDECGYCWKVEDGGGAVSDRVFKTVIHSDEDIEKTATASAAENTIPRTLEISFDRACQFACSYCSPTFSTTWAQDIRDKGAYADLATDDLQHYTHTHDYAQPYRHDEPNPYVDAFWRWWPELSASLKEIRVTGGEPMMSKDFWRLFDELDGSELDMIFAVNTNLGVKPKMLDRLVGGSKRIRNMEIYTSNEAVGAQAEYIRDGLSWPVWFDNLERLMDEGAVKKFHVMATINALCLYSLPEFLDRMLDLKKRYNRFFPCISLNILRTPEFQSIAVLLPEMRRERRQALQDWYDRNNDFREILPFEKEHIRRLIAYLGSEFPDNEPLVRDFKRFFQQYDARRGKNFEKAFPELTTWYRSIP